MLQPRTVLLASFIDRKDLDTAVQKIKENFVIVSSKIFILKNKNDENKLVLTYNIQVDGERVQFDQHIPGTVNLHRKKETNTLYTLNALNEIVKAENNGQLDKKFQISWLNYANCILITQRSKGLVRIETELEKILNLESVKVL
jgi:hypothetical protein